MSHLPIKAAGLPVKAGIIPCQISGDTVFDLVPADNLPEPNIQLPDRTYAKAWLVLVQIPLCNGRISYVGAVYALYLRRSLLERCFKKPMNAHQVKHCVGKADESFGGLRDLSPALATVSDQHELGLLRGVKDTIVQHLAADIGPEVSSARSPEWEARIVVWRSWRHPFAGCLVGRRHI